MINSKNFIDSIELNNKGSLSIILYFEEYLSRHFAKFSKLRVFFHLKGLPIVYCDQGVDTPNA
ncbi:MAG: hypothetical protein CBB92_02025 [Flammeovirgaceae bacterium TMED32]|nr:MAG: hypothetical protein CBB92_02025 [Flammeovirgaceae bacterium TMED32]